MMENVTDETPARSYRAFEAGVRAALSSLGHDQHDLDDVVEQLFHGRQDTFDLSRLYFEAHITLEPKAGCDFDTFRRGFQNDLWRVSAFAEDDVDNIVGKWFITSRSKSEVTMVNMVRTMCSALKSQGFTVLRAKIEDTIIDSKYGDQL